MNKHIFGNRLKTALIVGIIFSLLSSAVYFITYSLGFGRYAVVVGVGFSSVISIASF